MATHTNGQQHPLVTRLERLIVEAELLLDRMADPRATEDPDVHTDDIDEARRLIEGLAQSHPTLTRPAETQQQINDRLYEQLDAADL